MQGAPQDKKKPGGGSPAPTVIAVRRGERGTHAQPQLQG